MSDSEVVLKLFNQINDKLDDLRKEIVDMRLTMKDSDVELSKLDARIVALEKKEEPSLKERLFNKLLESLAGSWAYCLGISLFVGVAGGLGVDVLGLLKTLLVQLF